MSRYLPIEIWSIQNSAHTNISIISIGNVSAGYEAQQLVGYATPQPKPYGYIIVYLFVALMLILVIMLFITYMSYRQSTAQGVISPAMQRPMGSEGLFIRYTYSGLPKLLREAFIKLRNKFCGIYCTPRELALRFKKSEKLQIFVNVYEDVVYGAKERSDAYRVLQEVEDLYNGTK